MYKIQINQIKYTMHNLEQDLISTQSQIISWLNQYEKVGEEIIQSNYTIQLHNILESVSSFDQNRIKQCQSIVKDEIVIKYLSTISSKIKNQEVNQNKVQSKISQKKVQEPVERQSKISNNKDKQQKKDGFFGSIVKRLTSKEKKATSMIFPDKEPNCYYDPTTKSWIFQGQQPQIPKEIPKPPSTRQKKKVEEVKKSNDSQLGQLTAPPSFKRKSTGNSGAGKGKPKIKGEIQLAQSTNQPMTFAKVIQNINFQYSALLQNIKKGTYQNSIYHVEMHNNNSLDRFVNMAEKTLQFSIQINQSQNKMMSKWSKLIAGQDRQLKIMQKVLKQINSSASIYQNVVQQIQAGPAKYIRSNQKSFQNICNSSEVQQIAELQEKLQQITRQNKQLLQNNNSNQITFRELHQQIQQRQKQILILSRKQQELEQLKLNINSFSERQTHLIKDKQLQIKQLLSKYLNENKQLKESVQELQRHNFQLEKSNKQLEHALKISQATYACNYEKINAELNKQKNKIQSQLKIYQEKQNGYLKSLQNLQQHQNIVQQFEYALNQQNQLLNNLLQKRLQLSKNIQNEETGNFNRIFEQDHSQTIIFQLSDIVNSISETHLDRLQSFNRSYNKLQKKYINSKETLNKMKRDSANQHMSLNRSVTRLKSLLQTYKTAKEEAQQKCQHLQLQCDKLRNKLVHYKQEDTFNKSYLSKYKPSKISNQNESIVSLQQDNQELATEIDDLQKQLSQKDQAFNKLQTDLQDLLTNYQKNQNRLIEVQKKYKESDRQIRSFKQQREQLMNKIQVLELKLINQKQKNDEMINRQQSRLKIVQSNFDKKIKLLKQQLDLSIQKEQNLQIQIKQLRMELIVKAKQLQQFQMNQQRQIHRITQQKQAENEQILLLLEDTNSKLQLQIEENDQLNASNKELRQIESILKIKIDQVIDEHLQQIEVISNSEQNMNDVISTIILQYESYKKEEEQFKQHLSSKIIHLKQELQSSNQLSNQLLNQIKSYSQLIEQMEARLQQSNILQSRTQSIENKQLSQLVLFLQEESQQKNKEVSDLEEMIQKMSDEVVRYTNDHQQLKRVNTDLSQKLISKERQIQTLYNEINQKSQDLMIKTEQLQQKDYLMLVRQESTVVKKEEFDQLKNQLRSKDYQIKQLREDLQVIVAEINSSDDEGVVKKQAKQQIELLNKQLSELNQMLQEKTKQIRSLIEQSSNMQSILSQKNDAILQLNKQNIQRQITIINQQQKITQQQKQIALLREIDHLKEEQDKNIQEQKNEDVEEQMAYLLKEIQQKQNEISLLKDQLTDQVKEAKKHLIMMDELQAKEQSMASIIQTLRKQLSQKNNQQLIENKVIEELIQDIRIKDQVIIEKERQIQGKLSQVIVLQKQLGEKQLIIINLQKIIKQKTKSLTQSQINLQQTTRILISLQGQVKEKNDKIIELETNLTEMTEIIENQQKSIQSNKLIEHHGAQKDNEVNILKQTVERNEAQTHNLKMKMHDITKNIFQKERQYQGKIQTLEREIINLNSFKTINKRLEESFKALELENASLVNQKVELMKSNDYLVSINQKLVSDKSPHHSNKQIPKHQATSKDIIQKVETKQSKSQLKEEKVQPKGIFGALSSLFLTPTQTDRLVKK